MGFNLTNDIVIGSKQSGCFGTVVDGRLQFTISPLRACDGTFHVDEVRAVNLTGNYIYSWVFILVGVGH